MSDFAHLIAGAGFAAAVCARQLADGGRRVLLIDRGAHPGGNPADLLGLQKVFAATPVSRRGWT